MVTLEHKHVVAVINDTRLMLRIVRICSEGGVLSPLLWSVAVADFLEELNCHGIHAQGYADDDCIVGMGRDPDTVSDIVQAARMRVERWCVKSGLSVNARKTDLMVFTRKRKLGEINTALLAVEWLSIWG